MHYSFLYLLSLALLPIQVVGIDLGFMTLKPSQALFILYITISIIDRKTRIIRPKFEVLLLSLSFLGLLLSSIFSTDPERSSILSFAYLLCLAFLFATLTYLNSISNSYRKIKATLYVSSTIYSAYGISQLLLFFGGHNANVNFESWDLVPRVPYFSAENVHAAFLLAVIPIIYIDFIAQKHKTTSLLLISILAINFGGLIATGSRGAMLALLAATLAQTIIYTSKNPKSNYFTKLTILSISVILLVLKFFDELFIRFSSLVEGDDGTTSVRASHYEQIYRYFDSSPVFGIGLGNSLARSGHDVHNVLLQLLFEGGLAAFTPYFIAILLILYRTFLKEKHKPIDTTQKAASTGIFIAILLQAMMEPSLYFYHLYLAIGLVLYSATRDARRDHRR